MTLSQRSLILIPIILATVSAQNAFPAVVTSLADSGPGTLRAALDSATNGGTIRFAVAGRIVLTSGELLVNQSLTIVGPGAAHLAVDGNGTGRVFHISPNTVVNISRVTIANARSEEEGGGIFNDHGTVVVEDCILRDNAAELGGAIFNDGEEGTASVSVRNCVLSGNSAMFGGAIYNNGDAGHTVLEVHHSTVTRNWALSGGGGIGNIAGEEGHAEVTISASTFSGNSATNGEGGGVYNKSEEEGEAEVAIANSTFTSNLAFNGGGLYSNGEEVGDTLVQVLNSTFSGNSAQHLGGGIYHEIFNEESDEEIGDARLRVLNSTLSGNSAGAGGGAIFVAGFGPGATLEMGSTILHAVGSNNTVDFVGPAATISLGYNLSTDFSAHMLVQFTDRINTDPMLGPLQDNGGPTLTHALLCGSPAIDRGKDFSGTAADQRGLNFNRTLDDAFAPNVTGGDGTDIGAFERQTTCVSPDAALHRLLHLLNSSWPRPQSLRAKLDAALAAIERGKSAVAINHLEAFQREVRAQVQPSDPGLGQTFILAAEQIIGALTQ